MAPIHSLETRNKAKRYWEGGMNPQNVVDALKLNDGVIVPRRTVTDWAKKENWKDWRDAQQEKLATVNPNLPFGVTNIQDPVLHLATQQAKNMLYQALNETDLNEALNMTALESPSSLIQQCLAEVEHTYAIGVRGIEYLRRSVLPAYIRELKKIRDNERNTRQEDRPAKILSWTDIPSQVEQMIRMPLSPDASMDFIHQEDKASNYRIVRNGEEWDDSQMVAGNALSQDAFSVEERLLLLEEQVGFLVSVIKRLTGENPQRAIPLEDDIEPPDSFQAVGEMYYNEEGDFVPVPLSEELKSEIERLRKEALIGNEYTADLSGKGET